MNSQHPTGDAAHWPSRAWTAAILGIVAVAYVSLALPLIARQGAHWDEQTDLQIAATYLDGPLGPFIGSRDDAINTRLPMFTVAMLEPLGLALTVRNARLVSCALGVSTLFATFWLASLLTDRRRGLLAAALLGTSPYYLSYSPLAFTEGDAFIAAAGVWTAIAAVTFARNPTALRGAVLGIVLGLCLGAKISGVAFVLAIALSVLAPLAVAAFRAGRRAAPAENGAWLALLAAVAAWLVVQAVATGTASLHLGAWVPLLAQRRTVRYLAVFGLWAGLLAWSWRARHRRLSPTAVIVQPILAGVLTLFVFPPDHTTNPAISQQIWGHSLRSGHDVAPLVVAELAVFHVMVVLVKSSLPVGAALWAGLARAAAGIRQRPQLAVLVAMVACYEAFLLVLPLGQVRYQMAIFPLLVVLGADFLAWLGSRGRIRATAVAAALVTGLLVDYGLCYPDLNLNGYQWLGSRYFAGRATLAYRGIAQMGEDGVEQMLRWTEANVEPGATVVSYISARNLVQYLLPSPDFRLIDGVTQPDSLPAADYVLTSLNGDVDDGDGPANPTGNPFKCPFYDRGALERDFERVFSVRRAFGIEVAAAWHRR